MCGFPVYVAPPQPKEPEQEPAFYGFMREEECCVNICYTPWAAGGPNNKLPTAYYTSPPKRTWVGLDEEDDIDWEEGGSLRDLVEAVEAKLKEKNT